MGSETINRRQFLGAAATGFAAAIAGCGPNQVAKKNLQALLATDGSTTRLIDQNKKTFDPAALNGKTTLVLSGFYGCPVCANIRKTLAEAVKQLPGANFDVVVLNTFPENDSLDSSRDKYAQEYRDIGIPDDKLHILFTQSRQGNEWRADNEKVSTIENTLMNDITQGHSASIFVFDANGKRMGNGTFAAVKNETDRTQKATEIANKVQTSQRVGSSSPGRGRE